MIDGKLFSGFFSKDPINPGSRKGLRDGRRSDAASLVDVKNRDEFTAEAIANRINYEDPV